VGSGTFDYLDPVDSLLKLKCSQAKMFCGGMSSTYAWMLSMFDIPARTVEFTTQTFIDGGRRNDTHVTVEVYDKKTDRWYVSDPTFSISLMCQGRRQLADVEKPRECTINGEGISYVSNGIEYLKGRTVEEYYLPYSDLLFGVLSEESTALVDGKPIVRKQTELPNRDWMETALKQYQN